MRLEDSTSTYGSEALSKGCGAGGDGWWVWASWLRWAVVALWWMVVPVGLSNVITNGEFTGSLASWTVEGTIFNTGNQAVFSDSVATPTGLFQSVEVGEEFAGFEISFDVLSGLSPTVPLGSVLDSFFATLYLGRTAFGASLGSGVFDESVGLFDVDANGFFGVAAGATFGASPKGVGWTRYTLRSATAGLFEGAGFLTVGFQFFDLNGVAGDSTVAVDNVAVKVLSARLRWGLNGEGAWDTGATANWKLEAGETLRVFTAEAPVLFAAAGGRISIAPGGVTPGEMEVSRGGYVFEGGSIGGTGSLLKSGGGLLVLEAANTFTGGVVVEGDGVGLSGLECFCAGGVLEAEFCRQPGTAPVGSALWVMNGEGSATGTGPVQVGAGGALGGLGTVAGAVTLAGNAERRARLVPGGLESPVTQESLRLGNGLTVGAEAELLFRLNARGHTLLEVTGGVELQAGARIRLVLEGIFVPSAGTVIPLLQVTGGIITLDPGAQLELPAGIDWDTSDFALLGVVRVRGVAETLTLVTPPADQTVRPNEPAFFNVAATGPGPILVRWLKDGVVLPGETGFNLTLLSVTAADEGDYQAEVFNGQDRLTTAPARLVVRDFPRIVAQSQGGMFEEGDEGSLSVTATGPGTLSYVWTKDGVALSLPAETTELEFSSLELADAGRYQVTVSNAFGSVTSGLMVIGFLGESSLVNAPPVVAHSGALPAGQVGMPYFFPVSFEEDSLDGQIRRQPTRVTVSGLPSGLAYAASEGGITGIPRVSRASAYAVTITASNGSGRTVLRASLTVAPLATGFIGSYAGLVKRDPVLNEGRGGALRFKVSASGALSGTHDEGGKRRPFRGALALTGEPAEAAVPAMTLLRGRNQPVHTLSLTLNTASGRVTGGSLSDGVFDTAVAGWRNPWSRARPASKLEGYYTASLNWQTETDRANAGLPQGFGYLTWRVTARTGGVRTSGRLADGSVVTGSTFCGPNGQVLVYRTLYAAAVRGAVHGMVVLTPQLLIQGNTLEGCVTWNRPANLARSNRIYRDGFQVRALDVAGGRYTPPDKNTRVLGLSSESDRAELVFAGAGIENALPLQAQTVFVLSEKNRATFDKASNPRGVTFSINARTGLFRGVVNLRDNNPLLLPGKTVPVPRRVTYLGVLIGKEAEGAGYALIPRMPAVAGETTRNTIIESAAVLLMPLNP